METGLRLAAGLAPFWIAHGLIDEGKRSLAALARGLARAGPRRARALSVAGLLPVLEGDLDAPRAACRESLTLSRAARTGTAPSPERARNGGSLSRPAGWRRDASTARRSRWPRERDLWWPAALAQANLGALAGLEGRHPEAVERHEQAVAIARDGGDAWMVAACLVNPGRAVRQLGDLERASALQARRFAASSRSRTPGASPSA